MKKKNLKLLKTIGLSSIGLSMIAGSSLAIVSCSCSSSEQPNNPPPIINQPTNKTKIMVSKNENPTLDFSGLCEYDGMGNILFDYSNDPLIREVLNKLGIFSCISSSLPMYWKQNEKYFKLVDQVSTLDKYMNYKEDPNSTNERWFGIQTSVPIPYPGGADNDLKIENFYNPFSNEFARYIDTAADGRTYVYGAKLFTLDIDFLLHDHYSKWFTKWYSFPKGQFQGLRNDHMFDIVTLPNDLSPYIALKNDHPDDIRDVSTYTDHVMYGGEKVYANLDNNTPLLRIQKAKFKSNGDIDTTEFERISILTLICDLVNHYFKDLDSGRKGSYFNTGTGCTFNASLFGLYFVYKNIFNYFNVEKQYQDKVELQIKPISRCSDNGDTSGVYKYTGFNIKIQIDLVVKDEFKDQFEIIHDSNYQPYERIYSLSTKQKTYNDPNTGITYTIKNAPVSVNQYMAAPWLTYSNWAIIDEKYMVEATERLFYKYITTYVKLKEKYNYYDYICLSNNNTTRQAHAENVYSYQGATLNSPFWDGDSRLCEKYGDIYSDIDLGTTFFYQSRKTPNYDETNSISKNVYNNQKILNQSINTRNLRKSFIYNNLSINIFSDINIDYQNYENDITYFQNVEKYYSYLFTGNPNYKMNDEILYAAMTRYYGLKENFDLYLINWMPYLVSNFYTFPESSSVDYDYNQIGFYCISHSGFARLGASNYTHEVGNCWAPITLIPYDGGYEKSDLATTFARRFKDTNFFIDYKFKYFKDVDYNLFKKCFDIVYKDFYYYQNQYLPSIPW